MTQATPPIDVQPYHWLIVRDILRKHVPQYSVWAFGSRATWKSKTFSDLDLAVITTKPLSLEVSAELGEAFSESDLPWKVDIVDWSAISEDFRKVIARDKVVVQEPQKGSREVTILPLEACLDALIDYRGKTPRKVDAGIPLITEKVVKGGRIEPPKEFIAEEDYETWMTRGYPEVGDVVLTTEAPLGEVAQIKYLPAALAQRIITLRGKPDVLDSDYLLYLLQSDEMQTKLLGRSTGTTVVGIKQSELRKIELTLPPMGEQRAIAHILGTLDDKIELSRRRNQTLEAMARALFKDWFVDFGPVRAKMEGQEPYLPADLWQHFPDRLDDEGKPEGWETKRVSDYLSLAYGKSLPAGKRYQGDIPVYGSGGITGLHNEALVNGPAVIVGRKGTVGSLHWEDRPCFPIDTVFYVQPEAPLPFCYYLLESLPLRDMNTDAAVPGLNRENVYRLEVAAPPPELVSDFAKTASCYRESIAAISKDIETLAQLRDTLLSKLISGDLRIADAEKFIERAEHQASHPTRRVS